MPVPTRKYTSLESRLRSALAVLANADDALRLETALDVASPIEYSDLNTGVVRVAQSRYLLDLLSEVLNIVTTDQIAAWLDVLDDDGNIVRGNLPAAAPGIDRGDPLHRRRIVLDRSSLYVDNVADSAVYSLRTELPDDAVMLLTGPDKWRTFVYLEYAPIPAIPAAPLASDAPCPGCEDEENAAHVPGCATHIRNITPDADRDRDLPLVENARVTETEHGLHVEGTWTKHATDLIADGRINGMSMGPVADDVETIDTGYIAAEATALAAALYAADYSSLAAGRVLQEARNHMRQGIQSLKGSLTYISGAHPLAPKLTPIITLWEHRLKTTHAEPAPYPGAAALADTRETLLRAASLLNAL